MWLPLDILQSDNAVNCEFWAEELTEDVCGEWAAEKHVCEREKNSRILYMNMTTRGIS